MSFTIKISSNLLKHSLGNPVGVFINQTRDLWESTILKSNNIVLLPSPRPSNDSVDSILHKVVGEVCRA